MFQYAFNAQQDQDDTSGNRCLVFQDQCQFSAQTMTDQTDDESYGKYREAGQLRRYHESRQDDAGTERIDRSGY